MLKLIKFLLLGTVFGVILAEAQVVSWYRIYEMFQFDSFHMFGVIGSAVAVGIVGTALIKRNGKDFYNNPIKMPDKARSIPRYLFGGILFGLGWALVGACPGPMFILMGYGYWSILIVIAGALAGTFLYGLIRSKLPH